jgi:hypothetical protein
MEQNTISRTPWTLDGRQIRSFGKYLLTFQSTASVGRDEINAAAVVSAVNATYGNGINPAAIEELRDCLIDCVENILIDFPDDDPTKLRYKSALGKAKL